MLYEGMLLFGFLFAVGLAFGLITQTRNALDNRLGLQLVLFVALGVYFTWFWSKGQTLAMKTWHLRMTMPDGGRVPPSRAFLRYIFSLASILPPIATAYVLQIGTQTLVGLWVLWLAVWTGLSLFRPDRQLPQDVWAGTLLVYDQPTPSSASDKHLN